MERNPLNEPITVRNKILPLTLRDTVIDRKGEFNYRNNQITKSAKIKGTGRRRRRRAEEKVDDGDHFLSVFGGC